MVSSDLSGFYRLTMGERRARVAEITGLSEAQLQVLSGQAGLCDEHADRMVENALGVLGMPLGLCVNLTINGEDRLVPMAVEEPSVLAASSHAAKLLRAGGGITAEVSAPHMIGQVQLLEVKDHEAASLSILEAKAELLQLANSGHRNLVSAGGGALDLEVHTLSPQGETDPVGPMLVVHLVVDVQDAMGANAINSMCERLAPRLEQLSGGRSGLRILSNLSDRRTVTVRGKVPFGAFKKRGGKSPAQLARGIEEASVFAERDPYRAATHNKGIMNGVDAVLLAFGQDWRAVEAGAHAFAARDGRYTALARWRVEDEHLVGEMVLPLAVGTVGGVAKVHPTVQITRAIAKVRSAADLAALTASVGLAQNLAALRALAAEGIQSGHMRLHARNVAAEAGAEAHEIAAVAKLIADRKQVNKDGAEAALVEVRAQQAEQRAMELESFKDVKARFAEAAERFMPRILALIDEAVQEGSPSGSSLISMCSYHLQTGGKRLRALLPLLVAEALGAEPERLLPLGAACEMLHNATLVHDDLQDGDEVRRGKKTVWNEFGEAQAINLGDAMFYYTLLLAQKLSAPIALREATARRILVETLRVIDGQELEFGLKDKRSIGLEDYFKMVEGKTSGLFSLPMSGAAQVLGAEPEVIEGLAEAARHMGVLFQIQDDVLDLYGEKGRAMRGSDIGEGKRSVLVVHALCCASELDHRRLTEILDRPRASTSAQDVAEVIRIFERTGSLRFALDEMRDRKRRALAVGCAQDHPKLMALISGICELFLAPIEPLFADEGKAASQQALRELERHRRREAQDPEEELRFCFEVLPAVSRTFALSIGALPQSLRDAVCVAYLLCRIVDTVEDEAKIAPEERVRLFDLFDEAMTSDEVPLDSFIEGCLSVNLGANEAEKELCRRADAVFGSFRALSLEQREAVRPHVLEMSLGMREYTARADAVGKLRLNDVPDLERYCFYVAGTVGNLLTALFEQVVPSISEAQRALVRERAVAFGLGLQMVNIVKDVATDLTRGDCFLPLSLSAEHNIELEQILEPAHRDAGLAVIRAVCQVARGHLERAVEYTLAWPEQEGAPVRLFCAVPLALALASLEEVEQSEETLRPGFTPKISREMVAGLFTDVSASVSDNAALTEVLARFVRAPARAEQRIVAPQRPPVPKAAPRAEVKPAEKRGLNPYRSFEGKVLVTGASGHLGANLVRRLLSEGREVRVLLRQGSNNDAVSGLSVERVYGDLRDPERAHEAVKGCETIYHAAAMVSTEEGGAAHKRALYECNVLGTINLLRAARAHGVARTVVTGSMSAVGYNIDDPTLPSDEATPFYPFSSCLPYTRTKVLMEHECLKAVADGQDVVIAASGAIVGPHDYKPSRMGRTLLDYAEGKLRAYVPGGFEYVAAKDIVQGHLLAMHRGRPGQKYIFATAYTTLDEMMDLFEEVSGRRRPRIKLPAPLMEGLAEVSSLMGRIVQRGPQRLLLPGAARLLRMGRRADVRKAREELGFEPGSVREAVHEAYADFARRGLVPAGSTWTKAKRSFSAERAPARAEERQGASRLGGAKR